MPKNRNGGLRKRCGCPRRNWAKCPHGWHFNFKWRDVHYRLSLDREAGTAITSKSDAQAVADRIRIDIRAGRFRTVTPGSAATLDQLGDLYFAKRLTKNGEPLPIYERHRWNLMMRTNIRRANGIAQRFGTIEASALTKHDVEAFQEFHRQVRRETFVDARGRTRMRLRGGPVGANRCLLRLRAFYNWALANEYVAQTPFKRGTATVIHMFKETERDRRLEPGEEDRLLAACNPHLRALVTAALETCCRVGELLTLQWKHVRFDLNEIRLPALNTKARRMRVLPISQRLRALLNMRLHDPSGQVLGPDAFVFGNAVGECIQSVNTAWTAACHRAKIVGLNFHDLRREAGSRLLESGMPEHYVQRFLDHANLSTTSRYLKTTRRGMHEALTRVEERRNRCTTVAQETDSALTLTTNRTDPQGAEIIVSEEGTGHISTH
jgi:integrase